MTGMDHAIEQTAKVLAEHQWSAAIGGCRGGGCQWDGGDSEDEEERHAAHVVRALADAGLLAPAPLREMSKYVRTADEFCKGEQGTRTHRCWVTDWFPVDAVNRAEGDGRAEG